MDGLLKLLPVSRELLDAGFTLQVPQADGGVVTCRETTGVINSAAMSEALRVQSASVIWRRFDGHFSATYCPT